VAGPGTVVVGTDGSRACEPAVRFAVEEAARRGAVLVAVAAFALPPYWAVAYGASSVVESPEQLADAVQADAGRQVREQVAVAAEPAAAVPVAVRAVAGDAAGVLVDASHAADLLVVGHRGGGAVANRVIGSVAMACVLHAGCPVTIVPAAVLQDTTDRRRRETRRGGRDDHGDARDR
jgi:nucleotide-binding universal stress UspA family protein